MKIGIVFAGQGAQYEGMGKDLYDYYPKARKIFDQAGEQVKEWCFHSSKEVLRETQVTQPSVYTVTMAAYEVLMEEISKEESLKDKLEVIAYGGFSLGEYAALTAAGSIDCINTCNEIVSKRGILMHNAGMDEDGNSIGGMAAAFGKRDKIIEIVETMKSDKVLQVANFNSPVQTVVAGEKEAIQEFMVEAKKNKVKTVPLSVGTAFHTEMMKPASEGLLPMLLEAKMKAPTTLCYSNITGMDIMNEFDGRDVSVYLAEKMAEQISKSVYWEEIVNDMVNKGAEVIIEVGPGNTLSSFTRKINPEILTLNVENHQSLEETIKSLVEFGGENVKG